LKSARRYTYFLRASASTEARYAANAAIGVSTRAAVVATVVAVEIITGRSIREEGVGATAKRVKISEKNY